MRAWEFLSEQHPAQMGLRKLNSIKQHQREREASFARRRERVAIMYRDFERDLRELEVEKARLELEQLKADIAATQAETRSRVAKAEIEDEKQERLHQMAMNDVRRRKKA
jgi:hypothetical protein